MDAARTPDERFAALPDFPFEPRYREWEGLRLAHVDEDGGTRRNRIDFLRGDFPDLGAGLAKEVGV